MTIMVVAVPGRRVEDRPRLVSTTPDGIRLVEPAGKRRVTPLYLEKKGVDDPPGLVQALLVRSFVHGMTSREVGRALSSAERDAAVDHVASKLLVTHRSQRWREAVSTALLGDWCEPLWDSGRLPVTALGALKAEARCVHRQLVPVWRRRTRHGRVLSLEADLGDGLSLRDLVVADVDLLSWTVASVFADERLNTVLAKLAPAERAVVFAYAEGEGTTWTEAASAVGAADPEVFGERVRRKAKRLAGEQRRRAALRRPAAR
ncbi:hypothetical protein [Streptomyces canus]|uniref:hypothetical protein n=1 Tax=Streptomyces canus TaxID=58343 RepID=UPI00325257AB